ncbi:hypothetical protein SPSIL_012820 [Sporomusa silvacetica DSM 10669]|uniref:4Fe-4S ferredoxin-type domain-containing protein n=1 Tax=Sporomusa silvacetica DSM 10669 TaxID=1123289 RepID=A0ABZ3III7_9FIRM|nr:DUF362 domain-containing protein [Sporomusa silvacetica]OZC17424.1 NAD(P)H-quinone oxidoreductase subunit I, chloroplastic [Sporomusa silvacetica DSM 10669]
MNKVSIVRCNDYQYNNVEKSVFQCLDGIQEIKQKIKSKTKVLVKANLLRGSSPEDAITTHPSVVEAIVRYLQEMGCRVIIGDSPGSALSFDEKRLKSVYEITGMVEVATKTGCELNYDTSIIEVVNMAARNQKYMQIIKVVNDVDFVVSAAKLKTHAMMTYTGAVKNLFGVIPGRTKIDYHLKMNNVNNFAALLVDICEYIKPVFSVIDGVEGMEGDGPAAGDKRHVGLILASANPYAVDLAAIHTIGMKPEAVPTMVEAKKRGIFSSNWEDIEIKGEQWHEIKIEPFKLPATQSANAMGGLGIKGIPQFLQNFILNNMRPKPVFNYNICISCGLCAESCPPKAISMVNHRPVLHVEKCIRCFCCHELCPEKAVHIKRNWLYESLLH